jgi:hypothetical protein
MLNFDPWQVVGWLLALWLAMLLLPVLAAGGCLLAAYWPEFGAARRRRRERQVERQKQAAWQPAVGDRVSREWDGARGTIVSLPTRYYESGGFMVRLDKEGPDAGSALGYRKDYRFLRRGTRTEVQVARAAGPQPAAFREPARTDA